MCLKPQVCVCGGGGCCCGGADWCILLTMLIDVYQFVLLFAYVCMLTAFETLAVL